MNPPKLTDALTDVASRDTRFFGHPRGLSTLFFTEMWERFSYYGMRALLILFMTAAPAAGGLGFDAATAGAVYGLYTSMVYMTTLPGGWIADRLIGPQNAVLYGGIFIASGHFSMALPSLTSFYVGLVLIVIGGIRALTCMYAIVAVVLTTVSFRPDSASAALALMVVAMLALGMGNGSVFQLVPQRFRHEIGVMTGLVGMTGGIGGFYLASSLGLSKQHTGSYQAGLLLFASLAVVALIGLTSIKHRWRTTWGAATATVARV